MGMRQVATTVPAPAFKHSKTTTMHWLPNAVLDATTGHFLYALKILAHLANAYVHIVQCGSSLLKVCPF